MEEQLEDDALLSRFQAGNCDAVMAVWALEVIPSELEYTVDVMCVRDVVQKVASAKILCVQE